MADKLAQITYDLTRKEHFFEQKIDDFFALFVQSKWKKTRNIPKTEYKLT